MFLEIYIFNGDANSSMAFGGKPGFAAAYRPTFPFLSS